jgi:hypothetical protein
MTQAQVTLCLKGQTLTVPQSVASSLLSQGATQGACPPSPPPPFCTGKNACLQSAQCQITGPQCFCWVRALGGPPFCGAPAVLVDDCAECVGQQVCVLAFGQACPVNSLGCSEPCANPR